MTINIEREKAKRKIIALLNKTVDKGASESEATTAAEKAGELMAFYDIECGELEFQEKNIVKVMVPALSYAKRSYICSAAMGIAKLCQCRCWKSSSTGSLVFFGFKHDTDIAAAMFGYLEDAAIRALDEFQISEAFDAMIDAQYNRKSIIMSFMQGFDSRMYGRLNSMAKDREQKVVLSTGTSLVPLKEAEIDRELSQQGVRLRSSRSRAHASAGAAYYAGQAGADSTSINTQMGNAGGARRLA